MDRPVGAGRCGLRQLDRKAATARTLDDLCGKRNFLVRDLCLQDACLTPELSRTGACVDLRRKAEDERIRTIHTDR